MSDENAKLSLELDTGATVPSLDEAKAASDDLGESLDRVQDKLDRLAKRKDVVQAAAKMAAASRDVADAHRQRARSLRNLDDRLERLDRLQRRTTTQTRHAAAAAREARTASTRLSTATGKLDDRLERLEKAQKRATLTQDRLNRAQNRAEKQTRKLDRASAGLFARMRSGTRTLLVAAAAYLSVAAGIGALQNTAGAALTIDRIDISLEQAVGGAREARLEYGHLEQQIDRLALPIQSSLEGFTQLAAATRGTALAGKSTREIWLGLGEAAASLKLPGEQVEGALRAIVQIASKGKVQAEELRGQLGERLPGAFQIAARAMNMTTAELSKQLELGQVYADDFLPRFAAQLRKEFGGNLERALAAPQAQFERLRNEGFRLAASVGGVLLPGLSELAVQLTRVARQREVQEMLQDLARAVPELAAVVLQLALGFGADLLPVLADGIETFRIFLVENSALAEAIGKVLVGAMSAAVEVAAVLTQHLGALLSILAGLVTTLALLKLGVVIAGVWGLVKATSALAVAQNLVIAGTLVLQAAWTRLNLIFASNPLGMVAVGLGVLVTTLGLVATYTGDAESELSSYRQELEAGQPAIAGLVEGHEHLQIALERETEKRRELLTTLRETRDRLEEIRPLAAQMAEALDAGDPERYRELAEQAKALGVALQFSGQESAFRGVSREVEVLESTLRSAEVAYESNRKALGDLAADLEGTVGERLEGSLDALLKQRSDLAGFEEALERTRQKMETFHFGDDPKALSQFLALGREAEDLETRIAAAGDEVERLKARILGMADEVRDRLADLFRGGDLDAAEGLLNLVPDDLFAQLGFGDQTREQVIAFHRAMEAAYQREAEALEKLRREQERAEKATEKQIERYERLRGSILAATDEALDLAAELDRHGRVSRALADAIEVENQLRSKAASLTDAQRESLRLYIADQIQAERLLTGSEILADLRLQEDAHLRLVEAAGKSAQALANVTTQVQLEAEAHAEAADAASQQERSITGLLRKLRSLDVQLAGQELKLELEADVADLEAYNEALAESPLAAALMNRQLALQRDILDATRPLMAELALATEELSQRQNELALAGALIGDSSSGVVDGLREEVAALELEKETIEGLIQILTAWLEARERATQQGVEINYRRDLVRERDELKFYRAELDQASLSEKLLGTAVRRANVELEIRRRVAEAAAQGIALTTEEVRDLVEEEQRLARSISATENLGQSWLDLGTTIAQVLGGIDAQLGEMIGGLVEATAAMRTAIQTGNAADAAAAQRSAGGFAAGVIGAAGSSAGFFGGGTSNFGGRMSGNYGAEGAQIGGLFGPVGAIFGAVIGSLFEKGGDVAEIVLAEARDAAGGATARVERAEGGLKDVARQISDALQGFVDQFEALTGETLDAGLADLSIRIEDNQITVRIQGLVQTFDDVSSALAWASERILAAQENLGGVGDNVRALVEGVGKADPAGTFEDLQDALGLAQLADDLKAGLTIPSELTDRLREISALRDKELEIARRYGLVFEDVIRVTDHRIRQLREEIEASRQSLVGVNDPTRNVQALVQAMEQYNTALADEEATRRQLAAEASASASELEAALGTLAGAGEDAGIEAVNVFMASVTDGLKRSDLDDSADALRDALGGVAGGLRDTLRSAGDQRTAMRRAREEADALTGSLDDLGEAFSAQDIADQWTAAAKIAGEDLANLIDQVSGAQSTAAERQYLADIGHQLALAAQLSIVENLITTTKLLDATTVAVLESLLRKGQDALNALASGDATVTVSGGAPSFNPSSSGDGGAARRQEERADIGREMERLRLAASGVKESTLDLIDSFRDFDEWVDRARQLGIAEERIAQARADQAALDRRAIAEPHEESIRQRDESDLATELRQRAAAFDEALQNALLFAQREAERLGGSLEEVFGPLKDLILEDFASGVVDQLQERIAALVEAGDAQGLADLASDWDAFVASLADTPDLLAAIQEQMPELAEQIEEAFAQIRASALSSLGEDLGLEPLSDFAQQLASIRSRVSDAVEVLEIAGASEEELAEARAMGERAIANLIAAELDRFRALAGLSEGGSDPIDRFRALQTALDEVLANLAEAGAPIEDVAEALGIFVRGVARLREQELQRLGSALGLGTGPQTIAERASAFDEALETTLAHLEEMGAGEAELAEARRMHAEAIANLRAEQDQLLDTWRRMAPTTSPYVQRLEELNRQVRQARVDAAATAHGVLDLVKRLREIDAAARVARLAIGRDLAQALYDFGVQIPNFEEGMLRMEYSMLKASIAAYAASVSVEDFFATFGMNFGELMAELDRAFEERLKALQEGGGRSPRLDFSAQIDRVDDTLSDLAKKFLEIEANVNSFIAAVDDLGSSGGIMAEARQFQDSYQQVLDQVMELPQFMRNQLLPQLQDAYARGFQAIVDKAKEPLRNLLDELEGGSASGIAGREQLELQRRKVDELAAAAAAGDLDAMARLEVEARRLLELNDQVNAGGRTAGAIRDQVRAILQRTVDLDLSPDDVFHDPAELTAADLITAPVELAAEDLIVAPLSVGDILGALLAPDAGAPVLGAPAVEPPLGRPVLGGEEPDAIRVPLTTREIHAALFARRDQDTERRDRLRDRDARQRRLRSTGDRAQRRAARRQQVQRGAVQRGTPQRGAPQRGAPRRASAEPRVEVLRLPALPAPVAYPSAQIPPEIRHEQRQRDDHLRQEMAEMRRFLEELARRKSEWDEEIAAVLADELLRGERDTRKVLERSLDRGGRR